MSNPHKFDPNRRGLCKFTTRNGMCHLPKDAPVHKRYEDKIASDEELEMPEDSHKLDQDLHSGDLRNYR